MTTAEMKASTVGWKGERETGEVRAEGKNLREREREIRWRRGQRDRQVQRTFSFSSAAAAAPSVRAYVGSVSGGVARACVLHTDQPTGEW